MLYSSGASGRGSDACSAFPDGELRRPDPVRFAKITTHSHVVPLTGTAFDGQTS